MTKMTMATLNESKPAILSLLLLIQTTLPQMFRQNASFGFFFNFTAKIPGASLRRVTTVIIGVSNQTICGIIVS
jgi:hypothetical protein